MNSFGTKGQLKAGNLNYSIFRLAELEKKTGKKINKLPFSLKVMLENLLRNEDGKSVKKEDVEAVINWNPGKKSEKEISFRPARVLLQDFTGVPCVVDLAAMRDAISKMKGDAKKINPLQQVDLVIDHSVQVDYFGGADSFEQNTKIEFERNQERYQFLKWGQQALKNFSVVPPGTGIVHQVNLEYLAKVVFTKKEESETLAYPDTLVGTDSHTTMINGLGVVGWGVGGIEAEAAMLGQPISLLIPEVIGFKLTGKLHEGATATDLVLTVTQMLRKKGVVDKFVEFYGPGLSNLPLPDRATIANMSPEYGATIGFFPVDKETLNYLKLSGRDQQVIDLVEAYSKEQGLFRTDQTEDPEFTDTLELDLGNVEPSLAGPKRPQDRVGLKHSKKEFRKVLVDMLHGKKNDLDPQRVANWLDEGGSAVPPDPGVIHPDAKHLGKLEHSVPVEMNGSKFNIKSGTVVIAAITSCTNTSNPAVMIGAGLLAKKALAKGLKAKPWVKTSLAPGSKVVMDYLKKADVLDSLEKLNFHLVGFGCTTCIGNSGPLPEPIGQAIKKEDLIAVSVLSGNRNFEGRIHPLVKANYLMSPPLVVAYALAGTADINMEKEPLGKDNQGKPVYLKDIWPSQKEISDALLSVSSEMFRKEYAEVFEGEKDWKSLSVPKGDVFNWDVKSTYVKHPPYFENMPKEPAAVKNIQGARVLALLGDSVTTDHISPAGSIAEDSPAGKYLMEHGVTKKDFNSYGSRRGNHEVMMRGTFANVRLRNQLAPGTEGGWTKHFPDGKVTTIFEASQQYLKENIPLIVIAGKEYGSGSSRDWAAKGPALLGVKAVIAQSYERIHRSNLIGMGILPLQFQDGDTPEKLGLQGDETYEIKGVAEGLTPGKILDVQIQRSSGILNFKVKCRIQTPEELNYYRHGGILQYVLRQLV